MNWRKILSYKDISERDVEVVEYDGNVRVMDKWFFRNMTYLNKHNNHRYYDNKVPEHYFEKKEFLQKEARWEMFYHYDAWKLPEFSDYNIWSTDSAIKEKYPEKWEEFKSKKL